jgi:hypothetical protein
MESCQKSFITWVLIMPNYEIEVTHIGKKGQKWPRIYVVEAEDSGFAMEQIEDRYPDFPVKMLGETIDFSKY